jgi:outer membrane biosynthesis protein TonB
VRIVFALFLSLAIHLGVLGYLSYHKKDELKIEQQKAKKTHINYVKLLPNNQQELPKKIVQNQPIKEIFKEKIAPKPNPPKIVELPKETKVFELPPKVVPKEQPKVIEQPTSKPIVNEIPKTETKKVEQQKPQENIDKITIKCISLGISYEPLKINTILLARTIEAYPILNSLFLLFKRIFKKPFL